MEMGESAFETARREVEKETGVMIGEGSISGCIFLQGPFYETAKWG